MPQDPEPIRYEYGTPRYEIAPGVESPTAYEPLDIADLPVLPTKPGYYILSGDRTEWQPSDGLTYRTWSSTIFVTKETA